MIIGIILGVVYMFYFYCCVVFGKFDKDDVCVMFDLLLCEIVLFVLIVVVVFWMGVYFESFLKFMWIDVGVVLVWFEFVNFGGDVKLVMGVFFVVEVYYEGVY